MLELMPPISQEQAQIAGREILRFNHRLAETGLFTDEALLVRSGWFRQETAIVPRGKVQSATLLQPAWWRGRRVARLAVSAAGVQIAVPPIDEDDAHALLAALVPR